MKTNKQLSLWGRALTLALSGVTCQTLRGGNTNIQPGSFIITVKIFTAMKLPNEENKFFSPNLVLAKWLGRS